MVPTNIGIFLHGLKGGVHISVLCKMTWPTGMNKVTMINIDPYGTGRLVRFVVVLESSLI